MDIIDLGLIDYETAWKLQDEYAAQIAAGTRPPTLLLLEHPHVYTFGRKGNADNLLWNESQLKEKGYKAYLQNFEVNDAMLSRVVVMGIKNKIEARPNDLAKNKRLFQVYLKAEIARNVWDNQSFYPIINETNEVLQQAIKLFDRIPELNRSKM